MVYKLGGYFITYQQVREWLINAGLDPSPLDDLNIVRTLRRHVKDRIPIRVSTHDYPPGTAMVMLIRREGIDRRSTVSRFTRIAERPEDREVKALMMEESGLSAEDLVWRLVCDDQSLNH